MVVVGFKDGTGKFTPAVINRRRYGEYSREVVKENHSHFVKLADQKIENFAKAISNIMPQLTTYTDSKNNDLTRNKELFENVKNNHVIKLSENFYLEGGLYNNNNPNMRSNDVIRY